MLGFVRQLKPLLIANYSKLVGVIDNVSAF